MVFGHLILLLVSLQLPLALGGICPNGWASFGDFCYLLSPTQWDVDTARAVCQNRDAELVSFNTVDEREFIKVLVGAARIEFWIGAIKVDGQWEWTDKSSPPPNDDSIRDWDEGCPDGCEGDCVQMNHWNGLWAAVPCFWSRRFVCKRRNDIVDVCDLENGWHPYNNMCYKYIEEKRNWFDAQRYCVDNRGRLALFDKQIKFPILEEVITCKDFEAGIWLGLSDTDSPGEYKWLDGSAVTDSNWDVGQPKDMSDPANNCVHSLPVTNFKWRVDTCDRVNEFACEKTEGTCADGWLDYGTGYCYAVVGVEEDFRRSWTDAEHFCMETGMGGHLMKIENEKQQDALKSIVSSLADARVEQIRIGLSDMQLDNFLRWSDGSNVLYNIYGNLENTVRRMDCGFVETADDQSKWNTGYCFDNKAFICQLPVSRSPSVPPEPSGYACPAGWETDYRSGKCYTFPDNTMTYQEALTACNGGSKMVTIQTPDEQSFLSSRLRSRTWIGLEFRDNRHEWYDGSSLIFENWQAGGFDDAANSPCTVMLQTTPGLWFNENCYDHRNYICQQPATPTNTLLPPNPTAPWNVQCGTGWVFNPSTQACYRVVNSPQLTWEEAHLACQAIDSNLVSFHGFHETGFVNGLLFTAFESVNYWIGANDIDQSSGWKWSDGSPFFYFDWNDGEPNNKDGVEYCVELSADMEGRWNDIDCNRQFGYICKKPSIAATPLPSLVPPKPPVTCDSPLPLVSGLHYIRDVGFTASTSQEGRLPRYARLNHVSDGSIAGSWTGENGDPKMYVGVLFTHYVIVMGVITQGAGDRQEWVTGFNIMYRMQYGSFFEYVRAENGEVMNFAGNSDATTTRQHIFREPVLAHSVHIFPTQWQGAASLRFEVLGCVYEGCDPQPLVSGESMVVDDRMTASGSWDGNHLPDRARFSSIGLPGFAGGWVANSPWTTNQWIQVEFDTFMTIYAVQTKGREDYPQWIGSYKLLYTDDLSAWETYMEPYGQEKILPGNNDQNTVVTNWLKANIYLIRYLRIYAQEWTNGIGLRLEVLGCNSHWYGCTDIPLITGEHSVTSNSRLTASSSYEMTNTGPARSRLLSRASGELIGAWMPLVDDDQQWIQADLGRTQLIMAVATQGRQDAEMYVISYKLSHSNDGQNFGEYQVDGATKIFVANWDQHFVHKNYMEPTYSARYVRLHPVSWNVSIALRWEIYSCAGWAVASEIGCFADDFDVRDMNGATLQAPAEGMTQGACVSYCSEQGFIYAGLQWGDECWCDNSYGRYGTSDACRYPCSGDTSKTTICGGDLANTVLHTGSFSEDQILGCFSDAEIRDLPYEHYMDVPGGNTLPYCAMHCFSKGYRFAGAQYGSECYCGNTYGNYGPSSKCNFKCPGDHTGNSICGGEWSNTIVSTGMVADQPRCRDGWIPYGTHCYWFVVNATTWTNANIQCRILGSDLATVNFAVLDDFLTSRLGVLNMDAWIGLHCLRRNNYFEWVSGDPVLYTNWNRREPNAYSEDENCVEIYKTGKWNDDPCNTVYGKGYICQVLKEDIPESPTPSPDPNCPQGFVPYRWKCYTAGMGHWVWGMAKEQCENFGGNLARIEDTQEQAFLTSTFFRDGQAYWTDLTENGGQFTFSNGAAPPFTHWAAQEPADNGGNGCVVIDMNGEFGLWKSINCNEKPYAICEVPRIGETRPTPAVTGPSAGNCASGWYPIGNNDCFHPNGVSSNMRKTFIGAMASCREIGGDLVSIHSLEELNAIRIQVMSQPGDFWIGLNAMDNSQGFVWTDGSPVDFEYWSGPGLLMDDDEEDGNDCVDLYQATGTWNKIKCDSLRNWICKIRRGVVPSIPPTVPGPSPGPPGSCSPDSDDWKFFNNRCYLLTGRPLTDTSEFSWWDAESTCRKSGGNLVSIHTEDENRFIENLIRTANIEAFNMWTGLTDMNAQLSWQWSDESPTDYINWEDGQPNDVGGMSLCVALEIHSGAFGTWSNRHCESNFPFICVKRPGWAEITTPTPTVMPGFCPDGYLSYLNKCFMFVEEQVEWNKAHERCQETSPKPYSLATISDPWEQAFLQSQMVDRPTGRYWIGMYHYRGGSGEFGWVDNSMVTYTNWAAGEPNGGVNEGCVEIYSQSFRAGQWNDAVCANELSFICMRMKDPAITNPPPEPSYDCPSGYVMYQGNCFRGDSSTRNWADAESACVQEGGHLASTANAYETAFLVAQFRTVSNDLWIGLSDRQSIGRYAWSDLTSTTYTYWGAGKPGITDGSCVHISSSLNGRWSDSKCDASFASICKITKVPPAFTRAPEAGYCPSDSPSDQWMEFGDSCYLFNTQARLTQADAALQCQARRSILVSVHSEAENNFIYSHVEANVVQAQWIGLIRTVTDEFIWMDGSAIQYLGWNDDEPNNGGDGEENCVEMWMHNGRWNDIACGASNGYVCKKRQVYDLNSSFGPPSTPPSAATMPSVASETAPSVPLTSLQPGSGTPAPTTIIQVPNSSPGAVGSGSSLAPGSVAGIVFGVLVIAMIIVFIGMIHISRKRQAASYGQGQAAGGFANPSYASSPEKSAGSSASSAASGGGESGGIINFGSSDYSAA